MVGARGERHWRCSRRSIASGSAALDLVSTPSDLKDGGFQLRGSVMLLTPNVPVLGLDAPSSGGLFDLERIGRDVAGNLVG